MSHDDLALMEAALFGEPDPEITELEARIRAAQLAADTKSLDTLISEDLLFTGPNGQLGTKAQDLDAHASGAVRFRKHEPEELRIRRVGENVAVTALLANLTVEVGGNSVSGTYRYTRVWAREDNGPWQVVGGHVSEVGNSPRE
ncbi:MAG TPA: nuclear transport factor 2 family protein [Gemmatimonadaceae bacterium]|nr:nuclear transport factor 2 family protein [Gemmatimonadaceae bacterium]